MTAKRPLNEYPLTHEEGQVWEERVADAGVARAIYSKHGKRPFDVVYHDPRKGKRNGSNMDIAPYRSSEYVAKAREYAREYDARRE